MTGGVDVRPGVADFGPQDFTYLHTDSDNHPSHWAMVLELESGKPALALADILVRVCDRISLFELFRIGVEGGRETAPQIVVAETVDVDRHVAEVSFADKADLHRRIAAILEVPLPRPEPLWQITLLTPASGDDVQYILLKVHHSLSDGIAGAAFAALLADGSAEELSEFERFATSPRFRVDPIDEEQLAISRQTFESQWEAGNFDRNWPRLTASGKRAVALHSVSTRELRRVARRHSASVHEFLLAAVGAALSAVPPVSDSPAAQNFRVTLPVTLDPSFRHTGNAVSIALLNLLGGETDIDAQIAKVRSELEVIETRRPELAMAATEGGPDLDWATIRGLVGESMARMSPDIHVGINPGFTRVRSVLGTDIASLTALSPLVGYSLSVTGLILGTQTSFGIVVDPEALPGYADTFVAEFGKILSEA